LGNLASALTVLKAELADDKGSFGIHSPTTSGIYAILNNVFSRLQILTTRVTLLERALKIGHVVRPGSPGGEVTNLRSSVGPVTPISRKMVGEGSTPSPRVRNSGVNWSPSGRLTPLRKSMLDEPLDPWESEQIVQDWRNKQEYRKRIATLLKGTNPLSTVVSM
jgi:hypothetical protein